MAKLKAAVLAVLAALTVLIAVVCLLKLFYAPVGNKLSPANKSVQTTVPSKPAASGSSNGGQAAKAGQARLNQLYQQGYELYRQKHYQDAITVLDRVIAEDPGYYAAYTIKGIALCFDGHFNDGMKNIDQALKLKPDYGSARFNKALAYELYAYYDTALYWYDQTIAVEPDSVWSYYGKASIYGRRGDVANTVKNLEQAISLNPEVKKDARAEPDFNNVRNSPEFQNLVKD